MSSQPANAHIVVAIDGPGASGKSSTARALAKKLGFLYVDTGAMYRTLAWYCLRKKVDIDEARAIGAACRRWKTKLACVDNAIRLLADGLDPGTEIRSAKVSEAASKVASIPAVRRWMKRTQRECRQFGSLVMEGRDIGTNVFPDTDYKFFLDAPLEEREKRRKNDGEPEDLRERDRRDSQRAAAPLMVPLGARIINNAGLSVEETCQKILFELNRLIADNETRRRK